MEECPLSVDEEWFPLVDTEGRVTGRATRKMVHNGSKLLHPVVHLHIIAPGNVLLLQKRPLSKDIQPGKWDTGVGGHISENETPDQALRRETREETGLEYFTPRFIRKYIWESDIERELVYLFITHDHDDISIQSDEVDELRFWSVAEINAHLGHDLFTPNFEHDFQFLLEEGWLLEP